MGDDVYVIKDRINDSVFNGPYAYVLASIDPNLAYPLYNINDYYLPAKDSLKPLFLKKLMVINILGELFHKIII